ncbi:MAG: hypothetical protein WHX53_09390, partial [Anaerolineae bacterium]
MPPVEAWEKVYIDTEKYIKNDPHAKVANCIQCHGGVGGVDDMAVAHKGVVADPTAGADSATKLCGTCHAEITKAQVKSLHFDSHGYDTIIGQRLSDTAASRAAWDKAKANHCS